MCAVVRRRSARKDDEDTEPQLRGGDTHRKIRSTESTPGRVARICFVSNDRGPAGTFCLRQRNFFRRSYAHIGSQLTLSRPAHRIPLTESFQEICSSRQEVLDSKRTVVPGIWCTVSVQRPMPVLGYRAHRAGSVAEHSDSLGKRITAKRITVLGDQLPCVVSFMPLRIVLDTTGS